MLHRGWSWALLWLALPAPAQDYRSEQNDALGVRFKVHAHLHPVPLLLGEAPPEYRMQFEPKDESDYLHGKHGAYRWPLLVLEFGNKGGPLTGAAARAAQAAPSPAPAPGAARRAPAADFFAWVTDPRQCNHYRERTFAVRGRAQKGRGPTPDHEWWEYTDVVRMQQDGQSFDQIWFNTAAVYQLEGRSIALVCRVPVMRGNRPDPTQLRWMETMCQSLEVLLPGEQKAPPSADERDQGAVTAFQREELRKAVANIANLKGWDYYTTPHWIVLYSWNPERPEKQRDSLQFARSVTDHLERVRTLFERDFPPHGRQLLSYSVLRICDDFAEFNRYGGTDGGVIGWFNPSSRELVVFDDKDRLFGNDRDVLATAAHEAWHQYAHGYFGGALLHRWFDEGLGDWYGAHRWQNQRFDYLFDRGRKVSIRGQVQRETWIPLRELVNWNTDRFYGPRAPDHYAQGYSLIDFLCRGAGSGGRRFEDDWQQILPRYREAMLATKDQKQAMQKAFAGIDWQRFEAAWVEWVKSL